MERCHCLNDSVCDKKLGFCPNNLQCHPDWTSFGCSKRLPKLAKAPSVPVVTCSYVTVVWPAWNSNEDFGDGSLPLAEYRLYWRQNGTGSAGWTQAAKIAYNASLKVYQHNVTLVGDHFYEFRVDIHYSDDSKVVENASPGFVTQPLIYVLCTTTTTPPPLTVPIIVGSDIFDNMTASNQPGGAILVTWSIAPNLQRFPWNITLAYRVIATGDCSPETPSALTSFWVNQTVTNYSVASPAAWSRYEVVLTAQGMGVISTAKGTRTISPISAEIPPSGNVSEVRAEGVLSTAATLRWTPVNCTQRGGVLLRYDVTVRQLDASWTLNVTSNTASTRLEQLNPYTNYSARVRFVNSVGVGPFGQQVLFTTGEAAPTAVTISVLVVTPTNVTVNLTSPATANGVILDYDITYSTVTTFASAESMTLTVKAPLTEAPVIRNLQSNTVFYVKARARTSAGYGPYGNIVETRTLQAVAGPPSELLIKGRNLTCVTCSWSPPNSSALEVTGYRVTIRLAGSGQQVATSNLQANVTTISMCDLKPSTAYTVTVTSLSGADVAGEATSLLLSTELADPPVPIAPVLFNVSSTTATVFLNPVSRLEVTAYFLKVEALASRRRRQLAAVPGYETAKFLPGQVTGGMSFTVGDGLLYENYTNKPLEPGRRYRLHYLVRASANNDTKYAFTTMADTIVTLPTAPPINTTPVPNTTLTVLIPQKVSENNQDVLLGILLALLFVIIIIVVIIVVIICWRRRRNLKVPPPYMELDDRLKKKPAAPSPEPYEPEKYWNRIGSLRESRYIVVGRECLPDDQLIPTDPHTVLQLDAKPLSFGDEFKALPHNTAPTQEAEQHPQRNRFPHLLPFDHSRVELQPDPSSRCPYVNASWLSGYKRVRRYVAAQSPYNTQTAVDFWRLIHQHRIKTVVLIANVVEDNIVKCTEFWPREGKVTMGHFFLELREEQVYADFVVRDVQLRESQEQYARIVRLYEFTSWPDHGVPDDPIPFLDMRYKVRQYHGDDPGPILVHCGTGVARTGVFIAVDSLIDQYSIEGRISVYAFVRKMRMQRPRMVRTCKQYVFVYEAILEAFQAGLTMVDALTIKPMYHDWTTKNSKTGRSFLRDQFQLLQRLSRGPTHEDCLAASLPENAKRNRYPDVIPGDQHRPLLTTPSSLSKTDYINAIFLDGYRKQDQFIITQTPLHTTLCDFWRLVYDHQVTTIVMMDNFRHPDDTCAQYWLTNDVILKQWEPFFIEMTASFQQENVTIRSLKMVNTQIPNAGPHMVRQFQFNAWGENSFTPVSKTMVLDLLELVTDHHRTTSEQRDTPILVHCEDGATHSGLFVSLALLWEWMVEEQEVDVYHVIKHLKRRRPQIINDYDQYRFCYKTLWDYINLRMPGGTFTDTLGQNKTDRLYGAASLNLTSRRDSLY